MSSPEEMQSQSGKHAGDAADDNIVMVDEEAAVKEPGRGPWVPDGESSSAPAAGTGPGQAGPTAAGGPGGTPLPGADEADGASPMAGGGPGGMSRPGADEADGASPMAGGGPGGMSRPGADEADGASPMRAGEPRTTRSAADRGPRTGASAASQTPGAPPMAGDASPVGGRDPWTAPPSTGDDEGARSQAAGSPASTSARPSQTGPSASRDDRSWREIQGMFVDDPRDSVQRASDLIDTAIEEFLAAIRQQQAALASSWQNRDADTEVLRVALKDYRALWAVVRDMPAVGATGGGAAANVGVGGSSFGPGPGGPAGQHEPERGGTPA
jgi:hypothetical protein